MRSILLAVACVSACSSTAETPPPPAPPVEPATTPSALTARVVDGQCQGLGAGTTAQAGATLQTAPTERARLALSDGSTLVLDRESRVVLETAPRRLRLESGSAVLDVAHAAGAPPLTVRLGATGGEVRVLGTKLSIRAEGDRSVIDVSRGEVQLACPRGQEVVRAGEQGLMIAGQAPKVEASPDLGRALGWSEAGATDAEAGLGSLRGRRPRITTGAESELRLAEHRVTVSISGPVARTEVQQTFANDGDFELEGTYRFPLPAGARIAAMALEVDGAWREGRFVDRSTGERIWRGVQKNARMGGGLGRVNNDDILFAPGPWRDPALLAWEAGNRFSIRIFPIRPRSTRKVRLAYVETLPRTAGGERRYVYPLPQGQWAAIGKSVADRVTVGVRVDGPGARGPVRVQGLALREAREGETVVLSSQWDRFAPSGNLVVTMAAEETSAPVVASYRDGADLFAAVALRASLPRAAEARKLEQVLVLDSSYGSMGETWRRETAVVQALVREMDPEDRVTVLACDIGCKAIGAPSQVPGPALATALEAALARVEPGGTSDLVRAVAEASRTFSGPPSRRRGIVYVGDGVATVGVRDAGRVAELSGRASGEVQATISTIAVGTTSDARMLGAIASRTGGVAIDHVPGDDAGKLALRLLGRLRGAALEEATLTLPEGTSEVTPAALGTVWAGDEVWVAAKVAGATRGDAVLRGRLEGRPFEARIPVSFADAAAASDAWVPAVWAERRAIDLAAAGDQNREQVVALGTRFGLVTPFTSLLVLDSDALAERLGLGEATRPVQWTGEESDGPSEDATASRSAEASEPARQEPAENRGRDAPATGSIQGDRVEEAPGTPAVDVGGLGLRGQGGAGGGTGSGFGIGSWQTGPRAPVPQVRPGGSPEIRGALDRDVVRRVVLRSIGQIRFCYERELQRNPTLAGALRLQFVISPEGRVLSSSVASSTLANPNVENCIAGMARRWVFPAPDGGGIVMVSFPFRFQPGEPGVAPVGGWGGLAPVQVRVASVQEVRRAGAGGLEGAPQAVLREVATLRDALAKEPDRRKVHRDLARLFARIGAIDEGTATVRGWLARDAMDPEALTLLADLLARKGDRERAVRTLASVVEVQPGDKSAHERMAKLYERAGRLEDACAHRVTLAALSPDSDAAAAAATRCETTGEAPAPENVRGELVVSATFDAGVDLDVAVVLRDGTRVSWMGGKANVRSQNAPSLTTEKLALGFLPIGTHTLEVTRTAPGGGPPVSGTLDLRALGEHRQIAFRLEGDRVAAATVSVSMARSGRGF